MMKSINYVLVVVCLTAASYAGERKVLVEMFTNSHCSLCPSAHSAVKSYVSSSPNAHRVRNIYYHTTFPYSNDPLSLANTTEPNARNAYYNGPTSTPNTFFDGANQGRSYSSFASSLDARMNVDSPLGISLFGSKNGQSVTVTAVISQTGTISKTDLVVHMVAVENVSYVGNNGVSPQDFVMRKMITPLNGDPFTMDAGFSKQVTHSAQLTNITDMNNVGVVVFVQSVSTREVYQSEYISASTLTSVQKNSSSVPASFSLEQNFPNPFNPSTTISFSIPSDGFVSLKVFDMLGNEINGLINTHLESGSYSRRFSAADANISSGLYFYRLEHGGQTLVRKMVLLK